MSGEKAARIRWAVVGHSVRTAVTAMASFLIARSFRLSEAYWAPITTIVITQSSLGAALNVSSPAIRRNGPWSTSGCDCGCTFRTARICIWRLHTDSRFALRTGGLGPKRVSLRGCYARDYTLDTQNRTSLANCPAPVRRSVHWHRRRSDSDNSVARDGGDAAAQDMNTKHALGPSPRQEVRT